MPRGAGTGLSGGATPVPGCVVIECARMNRILELDAANRTATVQPGVINEHLSAAARPLGLFYAPDPSSQSACTIGGNVAENSGGPHTLKYGTTSPHVLELEVVLPDASIVRLGRRDGHAHGYDLRGVFVGSEGTLGIACAATVRLVPLPETIATVLASFASLREACATVSEIIARGIVPAALELIDDRTIAAVEASVYAAGYPRDARAVLLVELDGLAAEVARGARAHRGDLRRARRDRGARRARRRRAAGALARPQGRVRRDGPARPRPLRARRGRAAHEAPRGGRSDQPRRRVARDPDREHPARRRRQPAPEHHLRRRDPEQLRTIKEVGAEILRICVAAGGALSGEHGIGLEKRDVMCLLFDEADLAPMRWVHDAFDPGDRCNPGKLIPAPRACAESNPHNRAYARVSF